MHKSDSKRPSTPAVNPSRKAERKQAWMRDAKLEDVVEEILRFDSDEEVEFKAEAKINGGLNRRRSAHLTNKSSDLIGASIFRDTPTSVADLSDEKLIDAGRKPDNFVRPFDQN
jgi:hypothetical protein